MFRRAWQWLRHPLGAPRRTLTVLALLAIIAVGVALTGRQLWARHHYRTAGRALERYRLVEARDHLERCALIWSGDFQVHLLVAQTARRLGDYEAAEQHLARCQAIRGGIPEEVVLEQSLIRAQRGGMDSVTPYLRSLVEAHHPATPLILESMAQGYMRSYRFGDAAAILHLWRERSPDDLQANFLEGIVRERVGPEQEAVDNYRRVLEVDPEHDAARHQLAALLIDRAQPAEAMEHLAVLSQRRPGDLHVRVRLAQCQLALGRTAEAEAGLERVLAVNARFRPALAARGELALQLDQAAAAEGWLTSGTIAIDGEVVAL
ncbi:MAG: tetratricopeptide repeat protein, partial [Chloroflexota bacterium]